MNELDTSCFKDMLASAANNLENRHEEINTLNVFPVPDGDTGTNMNMTFGSGVAQTLEFKNENMGDVSKSLSRAMLMGARGNSGVILSQIFKGFAQVLAGLPTADVSQLARAFVNGSRVADKAVMKPVEGTILTVIRDAAEAARVYAEDPAAELAGLFAVMKKAADISLQRTPELLPVLKEAGVVDSGGAGLCAILDGFDLYWQGKPVAKLTAAPQAASAKPKESGYCIDIKVMLNGYASQEIDIERIKGSLSRMGDALSVTSANSEMNVHLHSMQPGDVMNQLQRYGEFTDVRIQNMSQPYEETAAAAPVHEKYAIITVCNGAGIEEMFRSMRVTHFISGGQTMNPSTESFINAIKEIDAEHIIILPNNGNIILAAQQAQDLLADQDITIIPSKSIPQGLSACIAYDEGSDLPTNVAAMNQAISSVKTGEVTYAVKDSMFNGVKIRRSDYIGLFGKDIVSATGDLMRTTKEMLVKMIDDSSSIVTVIYGAEVDERTANEVGRFITDKYHIDVQVVAGKQAIYSYIIGVE